MLLLVNPRGLKRLVLLANEDISGFDSVAWIEELSEAASEKGTETLEASGNISKTIEKWLREKI